MSAFAPTSTITVDGVELAYRRAGGGQPVLLLHGIPTSSRLWDGVARALDDFDVIALDLLGYGDSQKSLDRDLSISAQADLVPAFLHELRVESAVVVGHDIGGGVAQIVAVRHRDCVAALGLVDAVCFDSWPVPAMVALRRSAPLASRLPVGWVTGALARAMNAEVPPGEPREAMHESLAAWDADREALKAFFRNVEALDSRHTEAIVVELADIAVPTHVIWGAADRFQKPTFAPRLRDAIPAATLRMVDAGHFVPWQRPGEVAAEIQELAARARRT